MLKANFGPLARKESQQQIKTKEKSSSRPRCPPRRQQPPRLSPKTSRHPPKSNGFARALPRVKFDPLRITATIYNNYHLLLVKGCHSHMQGRYLLRKHYSRRKARVVGLNKIAKHGNSGREIYEYACREDICWVSIIAEGR